MIPPRWNGEVVESLLDSVPDAILIVNRPGEVVFANEQAAQLFGFSREQLHGKQVDTLLPARFRAHHQHHCQEFFNSTRARPMGAGLRLFALRGDGAEVPVDIALNPITIDSETLVITSIHDVTDRMRLEELKRAEEIQRESQLRFQLVADNAPVLIWMSNTDKLFTYFNKPWLDFTGRSFEQERGNGWADGIHPEDMSRCFDVYNQSFDRRTEFRMEYRLRRHDGEYRSVLNHGSPRFNHDGSFDGYVGTCIDVSDLKMAEEALSMVSRRLIEAQEKERTRIARDLHDDINQRLALLSLEMEDLKQRPPSSTNEMAHVLGELARRTREIVSEVQSISHRLHSSKLEYLGIAAAMRSLCSEFIAQYKVKIDLVLDEVSLNIPYEISLCLIRVLQEALHNAAKHSQADHFRVELWTSLSEANLKVHDSGVGFDYAGAIRGYGLGLISMRERTRAVNGTIVIDSKPGIGTTVHVRIPLTTKSDSVQMHG